MFGCDSLMRHFLVMVFQEIVGNIMRVLYRILKKVILEGFILLDLRIELLRLEFLYLHQVELSTITGRVPRFQKIASRCLLIYFNGMLSVKGEAVIFHSMIFLVSLIQRIHMIHFEGLLISRKNSDEIL